MRRGGGAARGPLAHVATMGPGGCAGRSDALCGRWRDQQVYACRLSPRTVHPRAATPNWGGQGSALQYGCVRQSARYLVELGAAGGEGTVGRFQRARKPPLSYGYRLPERPGVPVVGPPVINFDVSPRRPPLLPHRLRVECLNCERPWVARALCT